MPEIWGLNSNTCRCICLSHTTIRYKFITQGLWVVTATVGYYVFACLRHAVRLRVAYYILAMPLPILSVNLGVQRRLKE